MQIEWEVLVPIPADIPLSVVAECCQLVEGIDKRCGVHVCLTGDEHIHQINQEYRNIGRATDVLSFPTVQYPTGKTAHDCPKRLQAEYDPSMHACMLGDIILSVPHAIMQAEQFGHSVRREICYLFAHGLFHLMGYDHMQEDEQKEMRTMEEKALQMAGIARDENGSTITDDALVSLARKALDNSYSPYSHYAVGAALLCEDGRIFLGCNIENASYGLSNCGERTAIFKAVSEGARDFVAIAIASKGAPPYPCGACRQVLNEFAPAIRILVTLDENTYTTTDLPTLLPHGFGPKDLPTN